MQEALQFQLLHHLISATHHRYLVNRKQLKLLRQTNNRRVSALELSILYFITMLFSPIDRVIKVIASKHVVNMHFNVHDTQLLKLDYVWTFFGITQAFQTKNKWLCSHELTEINGHS